VENVRKERPKLSNFAGETFAVMIVFYIKSPFFCVIYFFFWLKMSFIISSDLNKIFVLFI